MALFTDGERAFAAAVSKLVYCNPFTPERIEHEREALGAEFQEPGPVWAVRTDVDDQVERPNVLRIQARVEALCEAARQRLLDGASPGRDELVLYEDIALYLLYYRTWARFRASILKSIDQPATRQRLGFYEEFLGGAKHFLEIRGVTMPTRDEPDRVFAMYFQIWRAFQHIFRHIVGSSLPAARLRAAVWQSIFSHDLRRYRRALYSRMGDLTTLITGASGTGKELVARAIALSRYIPFDAKTLTFEENFAESFHPLNLSALSPTLIESELFGHRRGAFTGALEDRAGWLEVCRPLGTVFLDEVGDTDAQIQVKLLRVLQTRTFQRIGDTKPRHFHGKVIAATNRDLAREMQAGRFREDFYYRLCSDMITTPTLHEQLSQSPGDLGNLLLFITRQLAGEEAEGLAAEVEAWIRSHLGSDYPWPGNFRELEQCVRNVMIRREYRPSPAPQREPHEELAEAIAAGSLTADQLLRRYCTLVYARTRSYEETARRLRLDRRTVKGKIDPGLLGGPPPLSET